MEERAYSYRAIEPLPNKIWQKVFKTFLMLPLFEGNYTLITQCLWIIYTICEFYTLRGNTLLPNL